jgi:predicted Zn-ribbon and HTH transcriptional regulator
MPNVLCFNCGGMFEVSYQTSNPTSACPKCQNKMFEEQTSFEE